MKNKFVINEDIVEIYIEASIGLQKAIIDLEDLSKVNSIKGSWYLIVRKGKIESVLTKVQIKKQRKKVAIHRLIMNCPKNMVVDHIDGNVLNNKKSNLRIVTQNENATNLAMETRRTKSGYTDIYIEHDNKYAVRIKNKRYGRYSTIDEALKVRNNIIFKEFPLRRDRYINYL